MENGIKRRIKVAHRCSTVGMYILAFPILVLIIGMLTDAISGVDTLIYMSMLLEVISIPLSLVPLSMAVSKYTALIREGIVTAWIRGMNIVSIIILSINALITLLFIFNIIFTPSHSSHGTYGGIW